MATASGIRSVLGIASESTYGTYKAPTDYQEFISESLKLSINRIESNSLQYNRQLQHRWEDGVHSIDGDINQELGANTAGILLNAGLGAVDTTAADASNPNIHKFTLGEVADKSFTVQVSRPQISGVLDTRAYLGCQIPDFEISAEVNGFVMLKTMITGQSMDSSKSAPTSITYSSGEPFRYSQGALTLGGNAVPVKSFSVKVENSLDTERTFIRASNPQYRSNAVVSGLRKISGNIDLGEYNKTLYDTFPAGTELPLVIDISNGAASTAERALKIEANVRIEEPSGPNTGGPEKLTLSLPFMVIGGDSDDEIFSIELKNDVASY